ncbi:MAG TPA: M14 family zinc carboxypeptidase, partial [Actinomycetota bacterium]|nr:M14 family zinc carboxypeptidase [Actinomycetota bacterium]
MDRVPMPEPRRPFSRREFLRRAGLGTGAVLAQSLLGPAAGALERTVRPEGLALARVTPRNAREALALAAFDDTHAIFADGSIELLLWPGDRRRLDRLGIEYRVTSTDLAAAQRRGGARTDGLAPQPGERTAYRVLDDFLLDMQALATQHPDKVRLFQYPERSLEGRTVYGMEIAANVHEPDGRPVIHIDGIHHSREWPSAELPIMFAFDLLESYGKDERMTRILDRGRVYITPVMNPDGFHHSRSAPTDTDPGSFLAYWRKNKRSYTNQLYSLGGTNPYLNADAHGTDPNRNYPFYWGGEGGNSDPRSETFAG